MYKRVECLQYPFRGFRTLSSAILFPTLCCAQIQLSNGQVVVTLFPLENFTVVNRSVRIEGNVSDGQWHSMKAVLSSGYVDIFVDYVYAVLFTFY